MGTVYSAPAETHLCSFACSRRDNAEEHSVFSSDPFAQSPPGKASWIPGGKRGGGFWGHPGALWGHKRREQEEAGVVTALCPPARLVGAPGPAPPQRQGRLGELLCTTEETPPPQSLQAHLHTPSLILLGYANICKQQSRESQK